MMNELQKQAHTFIIIVNLDLHQTHSNTLSLIARTKEKETAHDAIINKNSKNKQIISNKNKNSKNMIHQFIHLIITNTKQQKKNE